MVDRCTWARRLLLGWVAALAVGCPSSAPSSADAGPVDTAPSPEQEACEAAKEPCRSFVWQAGQCVPKVLVGAVCGETTQSCTVGVCDAAGECTGKQPATEGRVCVVTKLEVCRKFFGSCDANGGCVADVNVGATCQASDDPCGFGTCSAQGKCEPTTTGQPCQVSAPGPCLKTTGVCSADGTCAGEPKTGSPCSINGSPCGKGICDTKGVCSIKTAGTPCSVGAAPCIGGVCSDSGECQAKPLGKGVPCDLATGPCHTAFCDGNGHCNAAPVPEGTTCTVAAPAACETTSGTCSSAGKCVAKPAVGAPCKVGGSICATGLCNAAGGCDAKNVAPAGTVCTTDPVCGVATCDGQGGCSSSAPAPAGTPCTSSPQCGAATCDGKGGCVGDPVKVGKACGSSTSLTCAKYACNAAGQCALTPNPGAKCFAVADPDKATCHSANLCMGGVCGEAIGKCQLQALVGTACPSTSACTTGECSAAGGCEQLPVADGTKCTLGTKTDPECGGNFCVAGKCVMIAMTGKSCGNHPCKSGVCSSQGACEFAATPGKACGPQGPCGGMICDAQGVCKQTVKVGPGCDLGPCVAVSCAADGTCTQQVKVGAKCQDPDLCGEGVCNAQGQCVSPAYPKASECHVSTSSVLGECWAGVVGPSGACTKVARVGAACGCWVSPCSMGTCQADGTCLQKPSKPAGTPCSSDCVANGTCTPEGKCSGKTEVGKPCDDGERFKASSRCRKPTCQQNGDCAQVLAPEGSLCADFLYPSSAPAVDCGTPNHCDGQGLCVANSQWSDGTPCSTTPCSEKSTCFQGHCLALGKKPDNTACIEGCAHGACKNGSCESKKLDPNLSCDDGNACTSDICCTSAASDGCVTLPVGQCAHVAEPGPCGDATCTSGTCQLPTGACVWKAKQSGTPCHTDLCGITYTCSNSYCWPPPDAPFGACHDWNPCTLDKCTDCGCAYAADPAAEGKPCAQGGHCFKGNCVPD